MKNIQLIILLSTLLNAANINNALKSYEEQKYHDSYNKTKKLITQNYDNIALNLLFADSAFMIGKFNEALAGYDRVAILDSKNNYPLIQISRIYAIKKNVNMLNFSLNALANKKLNKNEQQAFKQLQQISKKLKNQTKNYTPLGQISLGLMYDNNINNAINKSFNLPSVNIHIKPDKKQKDMAHFENLYLQKNLVKKDNFMLDATLNIYNRTYFKTSDNDLFMISAKALPSYVFDNYKVIVPLAFDKIMLESNSYAHISSVGLTLQRLKDKYLYEMGYLYSDNNYIGKNKDKSSNSHNVFMGSKIMLNKESPFLLSFYFNYENAKEKKNLRSDISYNLYYLSLGLSKKIQKNTIASFDFDLLKYKYKDFDVNFLNKRKDTHFRYSLGLNYDISNRSSINLNTSYIDKKSNQAIYEYDRFMGSLYYNYKF